MRVAAAVGVDGDPRTRVLTGEERWRCVVYLDHVRVDNAVLADVEEGLVVCRDDRTGDTWERRGEVRVDWVDAIYRCDVCFQDFSAAAPRENDTSRDVPCSRCHHVETHQVDVIKPVLDLAWELENSKWTGVSAGKELVVEPLDISHLAHTIEDVPSDEQIARALDWKPEPK